MELVVHFYAECSKRRIIERRGACLGIALEAEYPEWKSSVWSLGVLSGYLPSGYSPATLRLEPTEALTLSFKPPHTSTLLDMATIWMCWFSLEL